MKTYYSRFVDHCIKFYVKYPYPCFHSEADKKNWFACDSAMKSLNENTRNMIACIYLDGADNFAESVNRIAQKNGIQSSSLWKTLENFKVILAKKRGLL